MKLKKVRDPRRVVVNAARCEEADSEVEMVPRHLTLKEASAVAHCAMRRFIESHHRSERLVHCAEPDREAFDFLDTQPKAAEERKGAEDGDDECWGLPYPD